MTDVMEAPKAPDAPGTVPRDGESLTWVSHPVVGAHRKNAILLSVLLVSGGLVYAATGSLGWSLISVAFLIFGVHDYLLPTTYLLSAEWASSKILFFTRRKRWSSLRSYQVDRNGVLVSPFSRPNRLDTFRGLYLRFDGNREAVLSYLRDRLGEGRP